MAPEKPGVYGIPLIEQDYVNVGGLQIFQAPDFIQQVKKSGNFLFILRG